MKPVGAEKTKTNNGEKRKGDKKNQTEKGEM
jgi:hypothetical protein